ncbi:PAS domain-containing protein [Sinorhizobium medicae]|nr:PAS domain-containing protein [Sinorhizobium medicae]MDX0636150.1 PAS domain-containing protein [Sinorhizobium medicae]MDX0695787.1 PAS domain-containing protein [Sinorhizobium medicae]MDX0745157.1 PAS domain-containing protein [Sinorhizobium medicae]MDX0906555.1 PAS domain-containing protein [Sinorhizobium medicae]
MVILSSGEVIDKSAAAHPVDFAAVFQAAPVGLAILNPDLRYVYCNDLLAEINGLPARDHLGRTVAEMVPNIARDVEKPFRSVFETGQPIFELRISGSTPKSPGIERSWLESVQPLRSGDGAVQHILVSVQEITALERAEVALRESERILRASQQLSPDSFTVLRAIRDTSGNCVDFVWEYANPSAQATLNAGPLVGKRLLEVLPGNRDHPDLFPRYVRTLAASGPEEVELRYDEDGISGWFRNCAVAIDSDRLAVSFQDISLRKRAEEQLALVTAEFRHRVKNTLAVVHGLVAQTARYAADVPSMERGLRYRLQALGAAQDLLGDDPQPADVHLDHVVHAALGPFEGKKLRCILNADARIGSGAVVSLTLALNELATNAIKYGALSSDGGAAEIRSELNAGRVRLSWREFGGPATVVPKRKGFGSRLIDEVARLLPAGRVMKDFSPQGLRVVIEFDSTTEPPPDVQALPSPPEHP